MLLIQQLIGGEVMEVRKFVGEPEPSDVKTENPDPRYDYWAMRFRMMKSSIRRVVGEFHRLERDL